MDASHFDRLAKSLSLTTQGNRRGLLGVLGMLSALAGLRSVRDAAGAKKRHAKRRQHGDDDHRVSAQKKRKKKKKCKSPPVAITCAGKCGQVTDLCKKPVDCGSCLCGLGCAACLTCRPDANGAGVCVADAQKRGTPCGAAGQVCQGDGTCRCDAQSCGNPTPICVGTVCQACSAAQRCPSGQCCQGGSCVNACAVNETCVNGVCTCPCALGCAPGSVQAAIDAAAPGATINLCPGTFGAITINKNLTLIGAGAGNSPATNTILDAQRSGTTVIVSADVTVTLQNMRITGGQAPATGAPDVGGGVDNSGTLTMVNCVVTGNKATQGLGGGISNRTATSTLILDGAFVLENEALDGGGISANGPVTLSNGSGVQNNTASENGGGIFVRGTLTLNNSSVAGNNAGGDGGGIYGRAVANVTLNGSTFVSNNRASGDGGGIFNGDDAPNVFEPRLTLNDQSVVSSNRADGDGGGIYLKNGFVTITGSSGIADNTAATGGGIFVAAGELTVSGTALITENTATSTGGILRTGGTVTVLPDSRVCGNTPAPQCSGFESNRCENFCPPTS